MKKYVFVLVGAVCAFLFSSNKSNHSDSHLYKLLSHENWGLLDEEKRLCIIVGIDYIPNELIELFENLTGVKVIVDIFDSNEILEAKLLAGGAKYDIVFPTAWPHFSRQLKAGIYQKLDKTRVDLSVFDRHVMQKLAIYDENNDHAVPFQFGISGIGLNEAIVNKLLGDGCDKGTLKLIFDPENAKKLSKYRISLYESPNEMFPALLAYLGLNPETEKEEDIIKAAEHLKKIRSHISKFTDFGFEDLASGNACVVLGTSGDIIKVQKGNDDKNIKFFYPREGASLWVDVAAIPIKAKHVNNAYAFFKFLFHPQIIAEVTNATSRANAVTEAAKYVDGDLINNNDIYPAANTQEKCYIEKPLPARLESLKNRLLTKIKSLNG